jgi:hypothetical protein
VLTAVASYFSVELIGYKTVALLLLMVVSLTAMLFDIIPVTACCAAECAHLEFFLYSAHTHLAYRIAGRHAYVFDVFCSCVY